MASVGLVFGLHLHQPIGNFDHVFQQHVDEVYLPFLAALEEQDVLPVTLHISGPLLDWLEAHDARYLDRVGALADRGKVELLLAGRYEPILAALPRRDRIDQVLWMRERLSARFGVTATGLWLTERVWEPDLPADLAEAGVEYVFVDDRHFLISGFERSELHWPYRTESDGRTLTVFPIDERLRYLVPFRSPAETAAYLRGLTEQGCPLAVLADDGEKFGGWPGTREWVYERGWLEQFLGTLVTLREQDAIYLTTPSEAIRRVACRGLAYLPCASYREMEAWALPPDAARRLERLEHEIGAERLAGPDGALLRGTHWRHFLVKYPEANRMHKKMVRLSALCRARGDPPEARHAIGRAQCNDAYWHGVFGGLYLPHLRAAVWGALAEAEGRLRADEPLTVETLDFDGDGHAELWVHSAAFSAVVSPRRGGAVEEFTVFATGTNWADTLTRRPEPYHRLSANDEAGQTREHHMEAAELPPYDADPRALLQERVLEAHADVAHFQRHAVGALASWTAHPFAAEPTIDGDRVVVRLRALAGPPLEKTITFRSDGTLAVRYQWEPGYFPPNGKFTVELSLPRACSHTTEPRAESWSYAIATIAKSERGLEQVEQGVGLVLLWPVAASGATLELRPD